MGIDILEKITAIKFISDKDPIFIEHFPENPIYPGALLIQNVLNTYYLYLKYSYNNLNQNQLSLKNIKFRQKCLPGDFIKIEIQQMEKYPMKEEYLFRVMRYNSYDLICIGKIIAIGRE